MTDRLNAIKFRESYRPIAPVCKASRYGRYFRGPGPENYMLYFSTVKDVARFAAVTHQDGTARVQTIPDGDESLLGILLDTFERHTGSGILCNTSLNFSGCGFINKMSDLVKFVENRDLDGAVVGEVYFGRNVSIGG